jgi:hypothetical protein
MRKNENENMSKMELADLGRVAFFYESQLGVF